MNRSLTKLLPCVLVMTAFPACGMEDEAESDQAAEADAAAVQQAHGDVPGSAPTGVDPARSTGASSVTPTDPMDVLALLLIDRSGSMQTMRSTGNTRCTDALSQAEGQLSALTGKGVTKFSVVTFSGATMVHTAYVDPMTAFMALDGLRAKGDADCVGSTPLAEAMCAAAADLHASSPVKTAYLDVSTDGKENSSVGECAGGPGDVTTPGTWPNKVETKIAAYGNIKVDDTYWLSPTLGTSVRRAAANGSGCSGDQCDDAFLARLSNDTGGDFRRVPDGNTAYPCAGNACPAPDSNNVGNRFAFNAANTSSATVNTVNYSVYVLAGETITLGTCGVNGASGTGDTLLRVFAPSGAQVASSDDACGGSLSNLTFTAQATGTYLVRAGCFASGSCSGVAAFTIQGSFTYQASNTSNALVNTTNRNVYLRAAQTIALGTCGVAGSSGSGDTYLRLLGPSSTEVAANDDSCGALSNLSYTVPPGIGGMHQIRAGCFSSTSCSGTVAYLITQP